MAIPRGCHEKCAQRLTMENRRIKVTVSLSDGSGRKKFNEIIYAHQTQSEYCIVSNRDSREVSEEITSVVRSR